MVQPYPDGVTTRRTSTLTLLSLGLPIVTNVGHLSEALWMESGAVRLAGAPEGKLIGDEVVALLANPRESAVLGTRGVALYEKRFAARHAVALLTAA
jgi:hypothetical protein